MLMLLFNFRTKEEDPFTYSQMKNSQVSVNRPEKNKTRISDGINMQFEEQNAYILELEVRTVPSILIGKICTKAFKCKSKSCIINFLNKHFLKSIHNWLCIYLYVNY